MSADAVTTRMMRAAVYQGPGVLEVQELPAPVPGPDDVLVHIEHCGVCGTDLHFVIEGWSTPGRVHGHEWAGRIVQTGGGVTGWVEGDLVVGGPLRCGTCRFCTGGRPALCSGRDATGGGTGAFAELHLAPARSLHRVPKGVPSRVAALAEPLAVSLHAVTLSGAVPGHRVLVTGAGPIGLFAVAALAAQGVDDVTVSEPSAVRRRRAQQVGAARTLLPRDLPLPPDMPGDVTDEPYDVVLECSGRPDAFETGVGLLGRAGTIVLVGTGLERPRLDCLRVLLNELVVTGAYEYDEHGFPAALQLLSSGALPVDALVEPADVDLDGLQDAMLAASRGDAAGKVLVRP